MRSAHHWQHRMDHTVVPFVGLPAASVQVERGAFPILDVNAEMLLRRRQVPLWRIRGFEKKYRRRYFGNQLYVAYFSEAMTRR